MGHSKEEAAPVVDSFLTGLYLLLASWSIIIVLRYTPRDTRWNMVNWVIMAFGVTISIVFTYQFVIYANR